jgi:tRNA 2-thiouridine synthesizing protein A
MTPAASPEDTQSYDVLVEARGLAWPIPLVKARQALMVIEPGKTVCVLATDPGAAADFDDFAEISVHALERSDRQAGVLVIVLRKKR